MADNTARIGPVILSVPRGPVRARRPGRLSSITGFRRYRQAKCCGSMWRGTSLGREAKAIMDRGSLVPDELIYGIVADRLREPDCRRGFVLDGFPRTAAQAGWLDAFLRKEFFENGFPGEGMACAPVVIQLAVDYTQLLLRITGRRTCPTDGRVYNIHFQPPKVDELCDVDGTPLITRNDDREEVVRDRLNVYEEQTRPVVEYYCGQDRLVTVNADLPIAQVTAEIFGVIDAHREPKADM